MLYLETFIVCTILVLISDQVYYLAVHRLQPSVARYAEVILQLATLHVTFGLWGYEDGTSLVQYIRKLAELAL